MPERFPESGAARGANTAPPISGPVRILFLDADGTLTDGVIGWDQDGDFRQFWVRDGIALEWARDLGLLPVVISGRDSAAVAGRLDDLGVESYTGIKDKVEVAERVIAREGVGWSACAMVGDDLPDVPLMKRVAWPIAVGSAQPEVKAIALTITERAGGFGAVREVVELLLQHNGKWEQVLEKYEVR